jgi:hypothetical protein
MFLLSPRFLAQDRPKSEELIAASLNHGSCAGDYLFDECTSQADRHQGGV